MMRSLLPSQCTDHACIYACMHTSLCMHTSWCTYVKLELAQALLPDFGWVSRTKGCIVHEDVLAESKSLCVGVEAHATLDH